MLPCVSLFSAKRINISRIFLQSTSVLHESWCLLLLGRWPGVRRSSSASPLSFLGSVFWQKVRQLPVLFCFAIFLGFCCECFQFLYFLLICHQSGTLSLCSARFRFWCYACPHLVDASSKAFDPQSAWVLTSSVYYMLSPLLYSSRALRSFSAVPPRATWPIARTVWTLPVIPAKAANRKRLLGWLPGLCICPKRFQKLHVVMCFVVGDHWRAVNNSANFWGAVLIAYDYECAKELSASLFLGSQKTIISGFVAVGPHCIWYQLIPKFGSMFMV